MALSFLNEIRLMLDDNIYHVAVNAKIVSELSILEFPKNFVFHEVRVKSNILTKKYNQARKLSALEQEVNPQIVFTLFGPSYWTPKSVHLVGFADGWAFNPRSEAHKALSFGKLVRAKTISRIKRYFLKLNSDYYVVESEDARRKISMYFAIRPDRIYVVNNTYSSAFNADRIGLLHDGNFRKIDSKKDAFLLAYIAHNHPNKNLSIISQVIPYIKDLNVQFVLTLPPSTFDKVFQSQSDCLINLGVVKNIECPSIYAQCDALFAPTLLETASAAYPEAMKMKIPILTSDLDFARDSCGEAAMYFDPLNPKDISIKIRNIMHDAALRSNLVAKSQEQLATFGNPKEKARKYLKICRDILDKRC